MTRSFNSNITFLILVIIVKSSNEKNINPKYLSTFKHTVAQQMYVEIESDYQFPRAVSRSLVDLFTSYIEIYFGGQRNPNQIVFNSMAASVPPGTPANEGLTIPVKLSIFDPDDIHVSSNKGIKEMNKSRIIRIVEEAFDQGGALTQSDISLILGLSNRTVVRYVKEIQDSGLFLHTRGNIRDIGPGVSHKTKIIELYLKNYEYGDIERRTKHSAGAIMRYIKEFSRIFILNEQGHTFNEIRVLSDISEKLLKEYLNLIEIYQGDEYEDRLDQIRAIAFKKRAWFEANNHQGASI